MIDIHGVFLDQFCQVLRRLPGQAEKEKQKANVKVARELICDNQGRLANYYFLSNQKLNALSTQVLKVNSIRKKTRNAVFSGNQELLQELKSLKQLHQDLEDYLIGAFDSIAKDNFRRLQDLYRYRVPSNKLPRVCVKVTQDGQTITLVREKDAPYFESAPAPVRSNTAFEWIRLTGRYFICNNIPREIKRDNYINPRINPVDVKSKYIFPSLAERFQYWRSGKKDNSWIDCWSRVEFPASKKLEKPTPDSCYKSTLVIPMTFLTNNGTLSEEFLHRFKMRYFRRKISLGFLCLDHVNINFFNSEDDVHFGYMLADILSLYLLQRLLCTDYSEDVFCESQRLLGDYTENDG